MRLVRGHKLNDDEKMKDKYNIDLHLINIGNEESGASTMSDIFSTRSDAHRQA
jgi:hypothetical protein